MKAKTLRPLGRRHVPHKDPPSTSHRSRGFDPLDSIEVDLMLNNTTTPSITGVNTSFKESKYSKRKVLL